MRKRGEFHPSFVSNAEVRYIYDATGAKLATEAGGSLTYYRSVFTYAKAGAAAEQLLQVLQPEGLVRREGGAWSWKYFKTDHVGSTRVLLAARGSGLVAEQTSDFYPFGTAHGAFENLHLNRYLYGGKEYQDAGIVLGMYDFHARYYNPMYGRWFNQDPRLQTTNPYLYNANSPAMYVDPDGEFFFSAILPGIGALIDAACWGAVISVGTNGISNVINDQPFFQGAGWAALTGAIGGFQSFGIGTLAQGMSKFGGIAFQTAMHGHLGGMMNMMNGGKYGAGFASGAFGSLAATGSGALLQDAGRLGQAAGMIGAGALSGGISSVIAGGNFMDGLRNGAISSGLNHAMHMMEGPGRSYVERDSGSDHLLNSSLSLAEKGYEKLDDWLTDMGIEAPNVRVMKRFIKTTGQIELVVSGYKYMVDVKHRNASIMQTADMTFNIVGAVGGPAGWGISLSYDLGMYGLEKGFNRMYPSYKNFESRSWNRFIQNIFGGPLNLYPMY